MRQKVIEPNLHSRQTVMKMSQILILIVKTMFMKRCNICTLSLSRSFILAKHSQKININNVKTQTLELHMKASNVPSDNKTRPNIFGIVHKNLKY